MDIETAKIGKRQAANLYLWIVDNLNSSAEINYYKNKNTVSVFELTETETEILTSQLKSIEVKFYIYK